MSPNPNLPVPDDFSPVPSTSVTTDVTAVDSPDESALDVLAVVLPADGDLPGELGDLDRDALAAVGFDGKPGSTFLLPRSGSPALLLVGAAAAAEVDANALRDAAATASRSSATFGGRLGIRVPATGVDAAEAGQVLTEGALLARYRYTALTCRAPGEAAHVVGPGCCGSRQRDGRGRHPHRSGHHSRDRDRARPREQPAGAPDRDRDG